MGTSRALQSSIALPPSFPQGSVTRLKPLEHPSGGLRVALWLLLPIREDGRALATGRAKLAVPHLPWDSSMILTLLTISATIN